MNEVLYHNMTDEELIHFVVNSDVDPLAKVLAERLDTALQGWDAAVDALEAAADAENDA